MQQQHSDTDSELHTDKGLSIDEAFSGGGLPVAVMAPPSTPSWHDHFQTIADIVQRYLYNSGGVLFRGFSVDGEKDFQEFARQFGFELLSYEFGSTPRTDLGDGVYTSTEYPPHQCIPLHNEQAYTRQWPLKIWFHCMVASQQGGQTPIADSRAIYNKLDAGLRRHFEEKQLMYVRNYGNGLDLPWQQAFNVDADSSDAKAKVEAICRRLHIDCEWKQDGELRTRQICQASAQHPHTGDWVWFNQAHLFHVSNLEPMVRETLLAVVPEIDLPRNVYYADGSAIEQSALEEIRGVLDEQAVVFDWQAGDLLMLDNMLTAHGRSPFKGDRKVVVAMAEGFIAPL